MSVHPLITQLRFTRSEFQRCLEGVSAEDAIHRFEPMNCISWIIGHLANQEHGYWVMVAQGRNVAPALNALVGYGRPASTPPLDEMWETWRTVTAAADEFLDTLTTDKLVTHLEWKGEPWRESIGTMLLRNTYHCWFHTGEAHAILMALHPPDAGTSRSAAVCRGYIRGCLPTRVKARGDLETRFNQNRCPQGQCHRYHPGHRGGAHCPPR